MKKIRITIRIAVWVVLLFLCNLWIPGGKVFAEEQIVYRLKWLINASTAGDVFASSQGFFSREKLNVEVKAGGPERDAIRELELGYAQFGVASADQVIRALSKGARVKVLAQLFQVNPLQWIYRADAFTLTRPMDLAGKTIGITYGGNDETIMRALLASAGMDETQVVLAGVRYDYTPFFQNKVPIWPVYRNTQGILLSDKLKAGEERVSFFNPAEHGVRFVANSVVTSKKMMDQAPETVRRFTKALLAGWEAAMMPANETNVIRALTVHDRDTSKPVMRSQLAATRLMIQSNPDIPIGTIDTEAWRQTEQIMARQGLIPGPINVVDHLNPDSGL